MTIALLMVPFMAWAAEPVGLGVANSFAVLAGTTITNTGGTTINGDVGLHDGTETPGFDEVTLNGELFVADDEALAAKNALTSAYLDAAGRTPDNATLGSELGATTVFGGVYASGSGAFEINGAVTLDAQGDPDTVWIFQMASSLTTGAGSSVVLTNGAQACNVYWQVGSSADLFSNTTFRGTILALTSINLQNGVSISGRALARNGAVTMDTNTITQVGCAAPVEATTTTTTVAATTTTTAAPAATTSTTVAPVTTSTTSGIDVLVTPTIPFPEGGAQTGGSPTSGTPDMTLVVVGAVLLASAAGVFGWRMHSIRRNS
ncbi:MAG: ice-binding family protein [Acidimicrobiia bacterium]